MKLEVEEVYDWNVDVSCLCKEEDVVRWVMHAQVIQSS